MYLENPIDVEPKGDRLLIFQSGKVEHEVLYAYEDRYAITVSNSLSILNNHRRGFIEPFQTHGAFSQRFCQL
jgi:hypothetical protein